MKNTGTLIVSDTNSDRELVLTRIFHAPRPMVYEAFTEPDQMRQWFGPRRWILTTCEVDHRVGGTFHFVLRGPDGQELGMRGTYLEIDPPFRSVHTESFDHHPGESQVTTQLTELAAGTTKLTATILYPTREIRDAVLKSGMEHGAAESYDKLEEFLGTKGAPTV